MLDYVRLRLVQVTNMVNLVTCPRDYLIIPSTGIVKRCFCSAERTLLELNNTLYAVCRLGFLSIEKLMLLSSQMRLKRVSVKPQPCVVDNWQLDSMTETSLRCLLATRDDMANQEIITITMSGKSSSYHLMVFVFSDIRDY